MLRNWSISSEFDTLLMYINLHTKCQIFLKKKNGHILQKDNHFK